MADASQSKFGLVFTKLRSGEGKKTPMLVTMTGEEFRLMKAMVDGCVKDAEAMQTRVAELEARLKLKTDPRGFAEDAIRSELKPGESAVMAEGFGEALSKMVDEGMVKIGGVAQ